MIVQIATVVRPDRWWSLDQFGEGLSIGFKCPRKEHGVRDVRNLYAFHVTSLNLHNLLLLILVGEKKSLRRFRDTKLTNDVYGNKMHSTSSERGHDRG